MKELTLWFINLQFININLINSLLLFFNSLIGCNLDVPQELEQATTALSSYLLDTCHLKLGDVVLLVFVPGLAFTASLVACMKAGLIGVPVYPPDPTRLGKELNHFTTIVKDCGAKVALTHATYSFAKTITDIKSIFNFWNTESGWPTLSWIQVDRVLKEGKTKTMDCGIRHNPQADIAFLQYTSGSTSSPKGVMVSPQNLACNLSHLRDGLRDGLPCDSDITVSWLPQYHDLGLIGMYFSTLYVGGSGHYVSPFTFLKDPLLWMRLIHKVRATATAGPSFSLGLLVRKLKEAKPQVQLEIRGLDLSCLEILSIGAEPVDALVLQSFMQEFGAMSLNPRAIKCHYGLAECVLSCGGLRCDDNGPLLLDKASLETKKVVILKQLKWTETLLAVEGAVMLVPVCPAKDSLSPTSIAIVDPDMLTECSPGLVGEIWVTGSCKTLGYYNRTDNQDNFFAKIRNSSNSKEYLRTGDAGFIHNNELYFCGRIKNLIIISGMNFYPQDIEKSAESCHSALRPGCSACFAVKQDNAHTECAVLIVEVWVYIQFIIFFLRC